MGKPEKGKRDGCITIRMGVEADTETFVELGRMVHAEGVSNSFPYSPQKIRSLCKSIFGNKKGRFVPLLAENGGEPVGMLIGMIDELFYSDVVIATCLVLYVIPEYRGSLAAVKLVHAFKRWAILCDAKAIQIHVTNGVRMKQTDRLLRKLDFEQTGGNYIHLFWDNIDNQIPVNRYALCIKNYIAQ